MAKRIIFIGVLLLCASVPIFAQQADADRNMQKEELSMHLKKLTPVLLANDIEACIDFWRTFGLELEISVPGPDNLIFAILAQGDIELMYQTIESAEADNASVVEGVNRAILYIEVASLDKILPLATEHDVIVPERTTPYGAREIYIRDPAGNVIGFAEQSAAP